MQNQNQLAQYNQASAQLINCLISLETARSSSEEEGIAAAKVEFYRIKSNLMPNESPRFALIRNYPSVGHLCITEGKKSVRKAIFLLINNFCKSLNIIRNMNQEQIIEASVIFTDEHTNLRLEDYVIMFELAKKGDLVKIMDRMDINILGQIRAEYMVMREIAGEKLMIEEYEAEERRLMQLEREKESHEAENHFSNLVALMKDWQKEIDENKSAERAKEREERQKSIDKQIADYAATHNIDINQLKKELGK